MTDGWSLVEHDGLTIASCDDLGRGRFAHGFSTRRDGTALDFDLGAATDRSPVTLDRRRRFLAACGLGGGIPFVLEQVHGVAVVRARPGPAPPPQADAALWEPEGSAPAVPCVRTADCVPILVVDPRRGAAAAIHAGWRGTAGAIAARTVRAMGEAGSDPRDLVAALGPSIGGCCYETGPDVAAAVAAVSGGEAGIVLHPEGAPRPRVDLRAANARQLLASGLGAGAVHVAPWCTRCRNDLFFSYRVEGAAAGRSMAAVGPAALA